MKFEGDKAHWLNYLRWRLVSQVRSYVVHKFHQPGEGFATDFISAQKFNIGPLLQDKSFLVPSIFASEPYVIVLIQIEIGIFETPAIPFLLRVPKRDSMNFTRLSLFTFSPTYFFEPSPAIFVKRELLFTFSEY